MAAWSWRAARVKARKPLRAKPRWLRWLNYERKKKKRRSEEHTSELQSQSNLVCRLLLEKKKKLDVRSFIRMIFSHTNYTSQALLTPRIMYELPTSALHHGTSVLSPSLPQTSSTRQYTP